MEDVLTVQGCRMGKNRGKEIELWHIWIMDKSPKDFENRINI